MQLERVGGSADEARNRLAEAMRDHREQLGYGRVTRTTKLMDLAVELLVQLGNDDAYTDGQCRGLPARDLCLHRQTGESDDDQDRELGNLQVCQATAGELDRHLERLIALGL
ncbi:hypothetical protein ABZ894_00490 [Nocardia beijingensis]|uniref:hypothetical protein n=1 Tax=Nocardia beijingensis TaxID=95162 RepID=UPI0033DFED05